MGFDPTFVQGCIVPLPDLVDRVRDSAFDEGAPIDHTRFSIIFSRERELAIVTAHNIDGLTTLPPGTIPRKNSFRFDTSVPNDIQIDNEQGYVHNPYDRGHLVRRAALHWGDLDCAREADSESFFWTNIAPQHTELHWTAWGRIENWLLDLADDKDKRASVFTGPVFTPEDPEFVNRPNELPIRIPAGYWKIVAVKHEGNLRAAAFLTWQRDFDKAEPVDFDPILEQVRITTIEFLTGLSFEALRDADPLRFGGELAADGARESSVPDRQLRPAAIMRKEDIVM